MKKIFFFFGGVFLFGMCLSFSPESFAVESGKLPGDGDSGFVPPPEEDILPELRGTDLRAKVLGVVNFFLTYTGLIGVLALIYYGFLWLTSGGDSDRISTGKTGVIYVALGILLILFSYILVNFFIDAGKGIQENSVAYNSNILYQKDIPVGTGILLPNGRNSVLHEDELEMKRQFDVLQKQLDDKTVDDVSVFFLQEIRQDYENILSEMKRSESTENIRYHLLEGDISWYHDDFLQKIKDFQVFLKQETQSSSEEEKKESVRELYRKKRTLWGNISSAFKEIKSKIKKIDRVDARITLQRKSDSLPMVVQMHGLSSNDPTKTTIPSENYFWSYLNYDGKQKVLGTGPHKTITFSEPGTYIVHLRVSSASSERILPGFTTVRIQVDPPELTADFTVDNKEVNSITSVSLYDAQKGITFDPGNTLLPEGIRASEYIWDFNGEQESTGPSPRAVKRIFNKKGEYDIILSVTDETGVTSNKKTVLDIKASIAVIDILTENPLVGNIVVVDGKRSSIENGKVSQYNWTIINPDGDIIKEVQDRPQFAYRFLEVGEYELQLSLGNGIQSSRRVRIYSQSPIPHFSTLKKDSFSAARIFFDASQSYDPDGDALLYSWDFDGDGQFDLQNQKDPLAFYTFTRPGLYTSRLVVTDIHGQSQEITQEIRIESTLFVDFTADAYVAHKGEKIFFNIQTNDAKSFFWDFGDGNDVRTSDAFYEHVFVKEGIYTVKLTASDESGNTVIQAKKIYIGDGKTPIVVLQAFSDNEPEELPIIQNICGEGKHGISSFRYDVLRFTAEKSVGISGDTSQLLYQWDFGSGEKDTEKTVKRKFVQISEEGKCQKVHIRVTDPISGTSSAQEIFVFVKNALPTIKQLTVHPPQETCTTPCSVEVSAEGAEDSDGEVVEYRFWAEQEGDTERIDFHTSQDKTSSITLPARGKKGQENTFFFFVDIVDNDGGKTRSQEALPPTSLQVINGNESIHVVDFFVDKTIIQTGESILFTAKTSLPKNTPNNSFWWDFNGDGVFDDKESGPSVSHTYSTEGTYSPQLQVVYQGVLGQKSREIRVGGSQDSVDVDFSFTQKGRLTGVFQDTSVGIPTTGTEQYLWDMDTSTDTDGDGNPANDHDLTGAGVQYTFPTKGEYSIRFFVVNDAGFSQERVKTVHVTGITPSDGDTVYERDEIRRNIFLSGDPSFSHLEVLFRKAPESSGDPMEVFVYGFDADKKFLSGLLSLEVTDALGEVFSESQEWNKEVMSFIISPQREITLPLMIQVVSDSPEGKITENIPFP